MRGISKMFAEHHTEILVTDLRLVYTRSKVAARSEAVSP